MSARRIAVLGGTGFLGANIVRALVAAGHEVRALSRSSAASPALAGCDVARVATDMRDGAAIARAIAGCDVLYHAAGAYPTTNLRATAQAEEARGTMRGILAAARHAGVARVVYTSSYAVIGPPPPGSGHTHATEQDVRPAGSGGHAYFEVKRVQEEEALAASRDGLPVVLLLPTACFGPHDARPTSGAAFVAVQRMRPPVYIRGLIDAIDVRDVADAHVAALDAGKAGERYILGHETHSMGAISAMIARAVGVGPPRFGVSPQLVGAVAEALEALERVHLAKAAPFVSGTMRLLRGFTPLDSTKGQRTFGAPRRSIAIAIADEASWLRAHGYIH